MNIETYAQQAATTAAYEDGNVYPYLGLIEEIGETAGVLAKAERDNNGLLDGERAERLVKELGDILWMIVAVARDMQRPLHKLCGTEFATGNSSEAPPVLELLSSLAAYAADITERRVEGGHAALTLYDAFRTWEDLCLAFGWQPARVAALNLAKLHDRKTRGVIQGQGDNR